MLRVNHLLSRKGRGIWSVDADEPVLEAIQIMADRHVGALPVLRSGELVGVVSERDYARKIILLGRSSAETPVWQIMSSPVVTVTSGETVKHCMEIMTERRIRHLPVVGADGQMVGMISIGDLVRAVIEEQQETIDHLEKFISGGAGGCQVCRIRKIAACRKPPAQMHLKVLFPVDRVEEISFPST